MVAGDYSVDVAFRLDALSALMLSFVTFVGTLIHVYSVGYMQEEEGYGRYFAYLNLFMFAMLTLVLADNLPLLFVGWEGVGLCSYLLIGYYYDKDFAAAAGKKAFVANRVGDFGMVLGIFGVFALFGTTDFSFVDLARRQALVRRRAAHRLRRLRPPLPRSRAARARRSRSTSGCRTRWRARRPSRPSSTPRRWSRRASTSSRAAAPLFVLAPDALTLVAWIGAGTAIFAATIGLAQNDIKKVLAYSTVSQLGYMFLACGVGAFGGRHVPRLHARLLQGLPLPRLGLRHHVACTTSRTCGRWAASPRGSRRPSGR